jgi:hypothetical protein
MCQRRGKLAKLSVFWTHKLQYFLENENRKFVFIQEEIIIGRGFLEKKEF